MKKLLLPALLLAVLVLAGCSTLIKNDNLPIEESEDQNINQDTASIYQCEANDDCVLVSVGGCCSFTSVNKNYRDEIEFVPMVCAQVCEQKAICENNACEVK